MKSNATNSVLTFVLFASLILSVIFCLQLIFRMRELRQLAFQVGQINSYRARMQMLVNASMEYSKTNTAIDAVLEPVGFKPKEARAAAKSAAK